MTMAPGLRKFALTAHVISSVGWLGAVAAFLALAIAGLTGRDAPLVRGAYLAMELTGWYVIVPLCLDSLLTGLVQSLLTQWGLFRHYWVLVKFLITVVSAFILFAYTRTLGHLAALAADATLSVDDLRNPTPRRPLRRRTFGAAGDYDAVGVQAPRHDPVRPAQAE